MSRWKQRLTRLAHRAERHLDALSHRLRPRRAGPVHILPYIGHGTHQALYLRGRVLRNYRVTGPRDHDTLWHNLLNMYRRFNSHELPGARIRARFGHLQQETIADDEGFFDLRLDLHAPPPDQPVWHTVDLELPDYPDQPNARATAHILLTPPTARFAVISDIDDTVIQSNAINWLRLAYNTLLHNARTRLPFAGVARFYQALQKGIHGGFNPIYYVSNSPWNLYDLLVDFFNLRGIPLGPLFLTDLGLSPTKLIRPSGVQHKLAHIRRLLATYPHIPFLLIGDSGEKDPEIYLQTVLDHPGRIPVIYIRDVTPHRRDTRLHAIAQQVRQAGSQMLLVPDTIAAAHHAAAHGFISPDALPAIHRECQHDTPH